MCLDFRILHNFNDMWKSTRSGAFLPICSFFRRSIRENPHRRMQIRLDVNFHGFCIRLRRSYLRDSPLSKDFEKKERSIFLQSKYFNRRGNQRSPAASWASLGGSYIRMCTDVCTSSAPSVRGLSPIGDWGSFCYVQNSFRRRSATPPSTREVKR